MPGRDAVQGVAHGDRPEPLRDGTGGIEPAIEVRLRQGLEVPERGPANLLRGGDDRVPVVGHTRAPHAEPVGTEERMTVPPPQAVIDHPIDMLGDVPERPRDRALSLRIANGFLGADPVHHAIEVAPGLDHESGRGDHVRTIRRRANRGTRNGAHARPRAAQATAVSVKGPAGSRCRQRSRSADSSVSPSVRAYSPAGPTPNVNGSHQSSKLG